MNTYFCYGCKSLVGSPKDLTTCTKCGCAELRKLGTASDDPEKRALARKIYEEIKKDLWG